MVAELKSDDWQVLQEFVCKWLNEYVKVDTLTLSANVPTMGSFVAYCCSTIEANEEHFWVLFLSCLTL